MDAAAARAGEGEGAVLRTGILLVLASAVVWSFGGAIGRAVAEPDPWTVVFWRSLFAAAFLLLFMALRDGPRGTLALIAAMRLPSLGVALCFATASTGFVVALGHTTVANIVFMQATVPLLATVFARIFLGEPILPATWVAIAAVIGGVGLMVSDSLSGRAALLGDGLALVIAVAFALATVITRARRDIRMVPAVWLGTVLAALVALAAGAGLAVADRDLALLVLFGAGNLGLGMALFVTGVRRVPAALASLIGVGEPVLAPVWTWAIHGEIPAARAIEGGALVILALFGHVLWQVLRGRRG